MAHATTGAKRVRSASRWRRKNQSITLDERYSFAIDANVKLRHLTGNTAMHQSLVQTLADLLLADALSTSTDDTHQEAHAAEYWHWGQLTAA